MKADCFVPADVTALLRRGNERSDLFIGEGLDIVSTIGGGMRAIGEASMPPSEMIQLNIARMFR